MASCQHRYRSVEKSCPHAAGPESELCPWHNPRVEKSSAYVGASLSGITALTDVVDFEECHLVGLEWPHAQLVGANFKAADLRDTNLRGANLSNADLRGAQLRRADLHNANLSNADLSGADLTDAQLSQANLTGATLCDTLIDGTILNGADLRETNVQGAAIESFQWNRLTRFSGIRGLEPQTDTAGSDDTQRYVAPFALGDHDISDGARTGLQQSDPDLQRTRVYRASHVGQGPSDGDKHITLEPLQETTTNTQTTAGARTTQHEGQSTAALTSLHRQVIHYRKQHRQFLIIIFLSVLIAVTAVGLALTGQLSTERADHTSIARDGQGSPSNTSGEPLPDTGLFGEQSTENQDNVAFYREQIATLSRDLDQLRDHSQTLSSQAERDRQHLDDLTASLVALQADNSRLHAQADEAARLRRESTRQHQRINQLLATNSRLERTAMILASGMEELQTELDRLNRLARAEQRDLAILEGFKQNVEKLQTKLAATEQQLIQERESKLSLEFDLTQAEQIMDALVRRIQGTPLESLLGTVADQATRVELSPDVPVVLGGDILLTLTVTPESQNRLRCALVIQGDPDQALPEVSMILEDRVGDTLYKLGFSFPENQRQPGFASAITIIEAPIFPAAARLVVTPNIEELLVRSQQQ